FIPHLIAVVSFVAISVAFFAPQLQGKVIRESDIVQNKAMANEHRTFEKELDEKILWTNAMFGGMPTYQITTVYAGNMLKYVNRMLYLGFKRPIGLFLMGMISFYILMMSLKINPWIGMLGALAFGLTTNNYVLYEAGHITKIITICYIPLVAAGIINAFNRQYLLGGLLFALGVGLNIFANHIQMSYYFFLTLIIFGVAQLIMDAKAGKIAEFFTAASVLAIAGLIGIGANASNLLTTNEYSQSTMRGKPILEVKNVDGAKSSSEVEGLELSYAMRWSNGTIDLFSTFIPRVAGSSSGENLGKESATYKKLRQRGARLGDSIPVPLYWGDLYSTAGSPYFGAAIVFLFILGLLVVKGAVKWWLGLGVLLTMMISMGKNLSWFNYFLFENLPLFNKFRTPNSVLSVTAALVPILAMLALVVMNNSTEDRKKLLRQLYIATGISAGIALFFALFGSSMFDFSGSNDANLAQYGYDLDAVKEDRASTMRSDAFRSAGIVLLAAGLLWAYLSEKVKFVWVLAGIGLVTVIDLWTINKRYIDKEDFVTQRNYDNAFEARPVDQQIMSLEKNRGAYRIMDLTNDPYNNAFPSYFHNTVGGYHPAKLQRIQDVIEQHLSSNFNQQVLDMLNTKYFIANVQNEPQVQQNPGALGNAWFVDTIRTVANANAEIDALSNFSARTTAIVHSDYQEYIAGLNPDGQGTISLNIDQYRPDYLTYNSNSSSEQLAVFSEVWYGPDKGWNAYIDGEPVEHMRVNYLLRALRVPAGQHQIEFRFEPATYSIGKTISLISSLLILFGLIGFIAYFLPKNAKQWQTASPSPTTNTPTKPTKAAPVKTKRKSRKKK
ncbi:MAG: YfhO family protein, partial [Bacteroidota bacterium]